MPVPRWFVYKLFALRFHCGYTFITKKVSRDFFTGHFFSKFLKGED